jgi:hypothetical protein
VGMGAILRTVVRRGGGDHQCGSVRPGQGHACGPSRPGLAGEGRPAPHGSGAPRRARGLEELRGLCGGVPPARQVSRMGGPSAWRSVSVVWPPALARCGREALQELH